MGRGILGRDVEQDWVGGGGMERRKQAAMLVLIISLISNISPAEYVDTTVLHL